MGTLDGTILPANGIFCSSKDNELYCAICVTDTNFNDWEKHIENPIHAGTLLRFNQIFQRCGTSVNCKVCNTVLDWDSLKSHASWHRIVPWFQHEKKYKTFFENHIMEWESEFYCYPCDVFFPEWSTAFDHIADKRHQCLIEVATPVSNFAPYLPDQVPYQTLVSEGFVSWGATTVKCTICVCHQIALRNVEQHVRGVKHANMKLLFVQEMQKWKNSKTGGEQFIESSCSNETATRKIEAEIVEVDNNGKEISDSIFESLPCVFIAEQSTTDFYCKICDLELPSRATADDHVKAMSHENAVKKYGGENIYLSKGDKYYCTCCDCQILGHHNVYLHVTGRRHANSLSGINGDVSISWQEPKIQIPVNAVASRQSENFYKSFLQNFPQNHIVELNDREVSCNICGMIVIDRSNVNNHVIGKSHALAAKAFTDNIWLGKDNKYYCKSCDCAIPGIRNVYLHINGNRHASSLYESKKEEGLMSHEIALEVEASQKAEDSFTTSCEILSHDHIVNLNETDFLCKICDCEILGLSSIEVHIAGDEHTSILKQFRDNLSCNEANKYHCRCCDCTILGLDNVYLHLRGIRHASSLKDSKKQEQTTSQKNLLEEQTPNEPENVSTPSSETSHDHIVKTNSADSCCKICDCEILGSSNIEDHVTGKRHAKALKQFCDNISIKKRDKYYCKCCDCTIRGIDNVYLHVQGNRHTSSLNASDEEQGLGSKESTDIVEEVKQSKLNAEQSESEEIQVAELESHFNEGSLSREENENTNGKINDCVNRFEQNGIKAPQVTTFKTQDRSDQLNFAMDNEKVPSKKVENTHSVKANNLSSKSKSNPANDTIITPRSNDVNLAFPTSSPVLLNEKMNTDRKRRVHKTDMQKIVWLLDFYENSVQNAKDKLSDIELGMKLCLVTDSKTTYCLICRKEIAATLSNYYEHLCSLDHCEYLEGLEKDHALFEIVPGQLSELDLAFQYMEEISEDVVRCHVCNMEIDNVDYALQVHITDENHKKSREEMLVNAKKNFEDIKPRIQCDWYKVHKYWCLPCSANFEYELSFAKHLKSTEHANVMKRLENTERRFIYDFCTPCALLWYGYRCTYANHCDVSTHKSMMRDEHYLSPELPTSAKRLLAMSEEYIQDTIKYLDEASTKEREKEETLIGDIEKAVRLKFPCAKVYIFGSRAFGLGTPDSGIDIFIDCGNMYDGKESSENQIRYYTTSVHECFSKDPQSWIKEELLENCRSSIVKVRHRVTGLFCDISVKNGLAVENTKLIKLINDAFPACRKMILLLAQWLALCDLSGSERISSRALCWYVIFFLQQESILPSIATLIAMDKSNTIVGREVDVSHNFSYNEAKCSSSVKELLIRFFTYYAKFDYRYDVACPLLGEVVKKRAFMDPQNLPKEMGTCMTYITNSDGPKSFPIDSAMCMQDPFDLQHNLTKDMSKVHLSRFRIYCGKSLDVLCSLQID